jgi:hypothetical protein
LGSVTTVVAVVGEVVVPPVLGAVPPVLGGVPPVVGGVVPPVLGGVPPVVGGVVPVVGGVVPVVGGVVPVVGGVVPVVDPLGTEPKLEPADESAPVTPVVGAGAGPVASAPVLVVFAWAPSELPPPDPAAEEELSPPMESATVISCGAGLVDDSGVPNASAGALAYSSANSAAISDRTAVL